MSFTPDSQHLAVGSRNNAVYIVNVKTLAVEHKLETPDENYWVGYSPDGKVLAAVGGDDKNVRLWSVPDYKPLHKP